MPGAREAATLILHIEDEVGGNSQFDRALALRDGAISAANAKKFEDALRLLDKARAALERVDGKLALSTGLLVDKSLVMWRSDKRSGALRLAVEALESVEQISPINTRQEERSHQYARALIGLFFQELGADKEVKSPPFKIGDASQLESDSTPPVGAKLKLLSDSWRILAVVEAGLGIDIGIDEKSMGKQEGLLLGTIELILRQQRYEQALKSESTSQALRKGVEFAWVSEVVKIDKSGTLDEVGLARVAVSDLDLPEASTLRVGASTRELLRGIVLDLLLRNAINHKMADRRFIVSLQQSIESILGTAHGFSDLIEAAAGNGQQNHTDPMIMQVTAIVSSEREMEYHPVYRFHHDMIVVGCVSNAVAKSSLTEAFVPKMVAGWAHTLEQQRFMLRSPSVHVSAIQTIIEEGGRPTLGLAARILLAAESAVDYKYGDGWRELLLKIAAK
jgi:hypothetical protein